MKYFYLIALLFPIYIFPNEKNKFDEGIFNWSRTFAETVDIMHQKFYKDFDPEESMIKAINAFVSIEPHSTFLDPKSFEKILKSTMQEFFGIGVVISNKKTPDDEFLVVLDIIPSSPAEKSGLLPGDKIIEIDNIALKGLITDEATDMLKGPKDSFVHIKIHRKNQSEFLKFNIKRDLIKEPNATCYYLNNQNIYYLGLSIFSKNAVKELEDLLKKFNKKNYKAIIIDLRNNSGGLVISAIEIAQLFLEKGSLVTTTKNKHNKILEKHITKKDPIANKLPPIFILINNYTASAAEILAGSLQIHSMQKNNPLVFLVGTKTFGKGSVQEVIPVSNDCAIKTTIALYYLPNNTTIQAKGIKPDFNIEMKYPPSDQITWVNKFYGQESSLKGYIETEEKDRKNKKLKINDETKSLQEQKKDNLENDYQLKRTVELINIYSLAPENLKNNRKDIVTFLKDKFLFDEKLDIEEIKA